MSEKRIEIRPINPIQMRVTIAGDGDLVLNRMDDVTVRALTDARKDKAKSTDKPNVWESVITAMHWRDPLPKDPLERAEWNENTLAEFLKTNAPCIPAFGLRKSWGDAVVRNEIDKYATKFMTQVNVIESLIPIKFTQHFVDEKLMSPKRGAPVLARLNRFTGWHATFTVNYTDNVYSDEQILNIINMAGFGLGIGSGRSSGYGRYHVENVS